MTTEEKIKEIINTVAIDIINVKSFTKSAIEAPQQIMDILASEIREEKIKMLEGMKYKRKNKLYNLSSGQLNSYRVKMKENKRINDLISELREEGKEKV